MGKSQQIKGGFKTFIIGRLIGWLSRIWGWTYRLDVVDHAGVTDRSRTSPVVFVVWHNRIFSSLPLWRKTCGHFPVVALMSASKDGSILESAVHVVGAETARGSSSRRGAAALIYMRRSLRAGKDGYVTPDGPRGPRYQLQAGALKLAQAECVPIVIKHIKMYNYWQISKSWDQLRIPKPFSKMRLEYDEPIIIPKGISEEEFELIRLQIEEKMNKTN